jgi:competence protein ComEA
MNGQTLAFRGLAIVAALIIGFAEFGPSAHESAPNIVISDDASNQQIAIEIHGAVATPGLYWLAGDARLQSAIDAAGGARPDADLSGVNLARRLADEEQIEIPFLPDPNATVSAPPSVAAASTQAAGKININLATAAELDVLPGIGPALAGRIVAYREQHGPFASLEELSNVKGISVGMVDDLRDLISLGS